MLQRPRRPDARLQPGRGAVLAALAVSVVAGPALAADVVKLDQANRMIIVRWEAAPEQKVVEAAFDVELRDPSTPDPAGGRSMTGAATLDCPRRLAKLTGLVIRSEPGLKGAEVRRFPQQTTWVRPEPSSLLSAVLEGVCGPAGRSRPPALLGASEAPPPPTRSSRHVEPLAPVRTKDSESRPDDPPKGEFRIQVGSFASKADAEARAAALGQSAPALPRARLETVRVRSVIHHRVLIDGFTAASAAETACRDLRASGTPCLVKSTRRR
ncbi:MAG: SPOR domain-containing protein [Proteobacteria bacterium]|nr:SPOR domain-containing protein [Pseudomonadota bacterium]